MITIKKYYYFRENQKVKICSLEEQENFPIPEKRRVFEVCLQNWEKKPSDFMIGIANIEKHIPKKYLGDIKKLMKNKSKGQDIQVRMRIEKNP